MSATCMDKDIKEILVPREKAVFRMDENGVWHNRHGRMTHSRIIEYFNTAIEQDADGYFLYQAYDDIREKVYFPYEGTALFAVDVIMDTGIILVLNTKKRVPLLPEALFTEKGRLCMRLDDGYVKFNENVQVLLSEFIREDKGRLIFLAESGSFEIIVSDSYFSLDKVE
jgi:hypothetical protein